VRKDMVRYTVEQRTFMRESSVKCGSARKCRRKFRLKFPGIKVPSTKGIHKLNNKVRSAGLLLDKEPANKTSYAYEKQDQVGARLENTQQKSMRRLYKRPVTRNRQQPKRRSGEFQPI
jgi:hypothetical protein